MISNRILCTYARRGGPKSHICIVHIGSEHENAGESAICNLEPAQAWIKELNPGDPIYVTSRIRRSDETGQLMTDASPNAFQPLYKNQKPEVVAKAQPLTSKAEFSPVSQAASDTASRRIETYLDDPDDLFIFMRLADHCSIKHAGNLLLRHSIQSLPSGIGNLSGEQIFKLLAPGEI